MREKAAVFLASFIILAAGAARPGIATAYVDPVGHIQAQDEAVYGSSSLEMARHFSITPHFLGRLALYKPPLLYWLSAIAAKIVGPGALALRLPSILAGAATVLLVFAILRATLPFAIALTGALLLLSSHLFFVLSRTGLTDALLVFQVTLAMYALLRDPRLDSPWLFGIATGAAIMTKAAAGVLPILILLFSGVPLVRMVQVCGIAAAVALPWHAWQLYRHPRWFWAEYVLGEHFVWAVKAPEQNTNESQIAYYARRIVGLDPVLLLAAILALFRTRPRVLIAWIAVVLVAAVAWQYRNTSYLAPIPPAMAILAAMVIPKRRARIALGAAAALFAVKLFFPQQPYGIPIAPESSNPSQSALDAYAALHRGRDLIMIEPDDQFYSADLDLPHVRYLWISSSPPVKMPLDFEYLGITVRASDYLRLDQLLPVFQKRLHEWNLDSTEPVATAILARDRAEVLDVILSSPRTDFYVPDGWNSPEHEIWRPPAIRGRVFLFAH